MKQDSSACVRNLLLAERFGMENVFHKNIELMETIKIKDVLCQDFNNLSMGLRYQILSKIARKYQDYERAATTMIEIMNGMPVNHLEYMCTRRHIEVDHERGSLPTTCPACRELELNRVISTYQDSIQTVLYAPRMCWIGFIMFIMINCCYRFCSIYQV